MTSRRTEATPERAPAVFISYRREDTAGHTGRLHDILRERFPGRVFMDIDRIEAGQDFVQAIDDAVGNCKVLLVMIGRQWVSVADAAGRRRLNQPEDFVRREVAAALGRGAAVIPVLVEGSTMPREEDLPGELKDLSRRNAIELSDTRWAYDVEQLVKALEKHVGPSTGATAGKSKGAAAKRIAAALLAVAALAAVGLAGRRLLSGPSAAEWREQDEALELTGKCLTASDNLLAFLLSWDALIKTMETEEDAAALQEQLDKHIDSYNSVTTEWAGRQPRLSQSMARPAAVSAAWSDAQNSLGEYMKCVEDFYMAILEEVTAEEGAPVRKARPADGCEARKRKAGETVGKLTADVAAARR